MDEKPERRSSFLRLGRILIRGVVIVSVIALLGSATFYYSRYAAHRRVIQLTKDSAGGLEVAWDGYRSGWWRVFISGDAELALLSRPSTLQVQREEISNEAILQFLRASVGLKHIYIKNRDLPEGALELIARQHAAETLHFRLPVIRAEDAGWLSRMKSMKHVDLGRFERRPQPSDWSWLAALPQLSSLDVTLWGADDKDVAALAGSSATRSVSLTGEAMSDKALETLCRCPGQRAVPRAGGFARHVVPSGSGGYRYTV